MATVKIKEGYTKAVAILPNKLNDRLRLKVKKQGDVSKILNAALVEYLDKLDREAA